MKEKHSPLKGTSLKQMNLITLDYTQNIIIVNFLLLRK